MAHHSPLSSQSKFSFFPSFHVYLVRAVCQAINHSLHPPSFFPSSIFACVFFVISSIINSASLYVTYGCLSLSLPPIPPPLSPSPPPPPPPPLHFYSSSYSHHHHHNHYLKFNLFSSLSFLLFLLFFSLSLSPHHLFFHSPSSLLSLPLSQGAEP